MPFVVYHNLLDYNSCVTRFAISLVKVAGGRVVSPDLFGFNEYYVNIYIYLFIYYHFTALYNMHYYEITIISLSVLSQC